MEAADIPNDVEVIIVTNEEGDVETCISRSGEPLKHAFVLENSIPHQRFMRKLRREGGGAATSDGVAARGPPGSIPVEVESGHCFLFQLHDHVTHCGSLVGLRELSFCGGFVAAEIKGVTEPRIRQLEFDMRTAFGGQRHLNPPGLITTQRERDDLLDSISPFDACIDPLLKEYNAEWRDSWFVGLSPSQHHFVGVYKSDWNGVSTNVCVNAGHEVGVHYYVVVHAGLPEETTEQLWRLSKALTGHLAWGEVAQATMFAEATEMARHARSTLLERALDVLGAHEVGERIVTEYNTFAETTYRDPMSTVGSRVAFYRGCASSEAAEHGVLTMANLKAKDQGIWWLHGAPNCSRIGGGPWSHTETANAMPIFRNRKFDEVSTRLERFGYNNHWGKAFLSPIYVIE